MEFGKHMVGVASGFSITNAGLSGPIGAPINELLNGGEDPGYLLSIWEGLKDIPQSLGFGGRIYSQEPFAEYVSREGTKYRITEQGHSSTTTEVTLYIGDDGVISGASVWKGEGGVNNIRSSGRSGDIEDVFHHQDTEDLGQRLERFLEEYEAATGETIQASSFEYKGAVVDLPTRAVSALEVTPTPEAAISLVEPENFNETYRGPPKNDWNPFN